MDRIVLEGMQFFGYHGTHPAEATLGQRFEVDVTVGVDLREAAQADDLALGVDYSRFFDIAKSVVEGRPYKLTEAVAEDIAQQILADTAAVHWVTVRVAKPWVRLADTVLRGSAVIIERSR